MFYTIPRQQFISNALAASCVWTDLIRDSENFNSKYFVDEDNTFYLSINYGSGDGIVIFDSYSSEALEKAKNIFPNAVGFTFACDIDKYNDAEIKEKHGVTFHYKLVERKNTSKTDIKVEKISDDNCIDTLKTYDDMYLSFLREDHGARLLNFWNRERDKILNGDEELYIARNENDTLIGFVMVDVYKELKACDITQISIEDAFQNQGYGKQLLQKVVSELQKSNIDIYYSSVNDDNIASKKIAEHIGFKAVACRIHLIT